MMSHMSFLQTPQERQQLVHQLGHMVLLIEATSDICLLREDEANMPNSQKLMPQYQMNWHQLVVARVRLFFCKLMHIMTLHRVLIDLGY